MMYEKLFATVLFLSFEKHFYKEKLDTPTFPMRHRLQQSCHFMPHEKYLLSRCAFICS